MAFGIEKAKISPFLHNQLEGEKVDKEINCNDIFIMGKIKESMIREDASCMEEIHGIPSLT